MTEFINTVKIIPKFKTTLNYLLTYVKMRQIEHNHNQNKVHQSEGKFTEKQKK